MQEILKLFREANIKNDWGEQSYIHMLDDGSGEVVSEDDEYEGETVFEFNSPEDLIKQLKKSLR